MSETTPEATAETTKPTESTDTEQAVDHEAEAKKWQALARKHEERAKANATAARELEELRKASMSEQEKAVEQAKTEARTAVLREVGARIVDAEFRAAAAGRLDPERVDALLDGLDRSRFITDDGEVDRDKVAEFVGRIAPEPAAPARPDLGQGVRQSAAMALNDDALAASIQALMNAR